MGAKLDEQSVDGGPGQFSDPEFRERLRSLPPSAKLVARVLAIEAPLTQDRIAAESLLPERTVRYALGRLEEADLVCSRYSFEDARKQVYSLRD